MYYWITSDSDSDNDSVCIKNYIQFFFKVDFCKIIVKKNAGTKFYIDFSISIKKKTALAFRVSRKSRIIGRQRSNL